MNAVDMDKYFTRPIDTGFFQITAQEASKLCGDAGLPKFGRCRVVVINEKEYRVMETKHGDKYVWSIH